MIVSSSHIPNITRETKIVVLSCSVHTQNGAVEVNFSADMREPVLNSTVTYQESGNALRLISTLIKLERYRED